MKVLFINSVCGIGSTGRIHFIIHYYKQWSCCQRIGSPRYTVLET